MIRKKIAIAAIAGIVAVTSITVQSPMAFAAQETQTESEAECSASVKFDDISVKVLNDMDLFDVMVKGSWDVKWNAKKDVQSSCVHYGSFTLAKDSYVRIKVATEGDKPDIGWEESYYIYDNPSMNNEMYDKRVGSSDHYYELKAGTYYVKVAGEFSYFTKTTDHTDKFMIGAIAQEDAVKVTQRANSSKTAMDIIVNEKIMTDKRGSIKIAKADEPGDVEWGDFFDDQFTDISETGIYTATESGNYIVRVLARSTVAGGRDAVIYVKVNVNLDDHKAPIISGVQNGKFYNRQVKISFRDDEGGCGVAKATLDGKDVKSGTVVSAEGRHVLVVSDMLGNTATASFTIDKTRPTVSGAANNKCYKRNVKLTYSDNKSGSGIKSATLNGKNIKSGKTVTAAGKYTFKTVDKAGNVTTVKFVIDKTKPVVSGVKNRKTYKKNVKIKFRDNKGGSGIKSAKLNGRNIKNGKVVKKAGRYMLRVTDKAGNVTRMTFRIRK